MPDTDTLPEIVDDTAEVVQPPKQAEFPVDSLREAAIHLRRPFSPGAVKFKVQTVWPKPPKGQDSPLPHSALIVTYIDARLVVDRLNLVCPHLWSEEMVPVDGSRMVCKLTVDGVTHVDLGTSVGQGATAAKGLYSDALKRAGVKFGIGVSLYALPKFILKTGDGHVEVRRTKDGPTLVVTPNGETRLRDMYESWLTLAGVKVFGLALDHGDATDGSIGDPDDPGHQDGSVEDPEAESGDGTITLKRAKQLVALAKHGGVASDKLRLAATNEFGDDVGDCSTQGKAWKSLRQLNPQQADKVEAWITGREVSDA